MLSRTFTRWTTRRKKFFNTKKEVLYEKGLIHTEVGDRESALDCFKQIYEVDYGYRDVAQRVESSYS
jgi:hypothetical protein